MILARPLALVVADAAERVPPPVVRTLKFTVIPGTAAPTLLTARTSSDLAAVELCSTDWLFPPVTSNNDPVEVLTPVLATFRLKTTLPETDDAKTAIVPVVLEAVNVVLAFPFAPVVAVTVAVEFERVPPLAVVTVKVTDTPATGDPEALVAMTSKGSADALHHASLLIQRMPHSDSRFVRYPMQSLKLNLCRLRSW